jgi:predicted nucleic acid-binding Zn ribbon protein
MGDVRHHRPHLLTRPAARVVVVLAAVIFTGAAVHFAVTAYEARDCFTTASDVSSGEPQRRQPVESDDCRQVLSRSEDRQRTDATIAILAVAVGIGAAVRLSKASRRTRRVILVVEIVVLGVGAVYIILLSAMLR